MNTKAQGCVDVTASFVAQLACTFFGSPAVSLHARGTPV